MKNNSANKIRDSQFKKLASWLLRPKLLISLFLTIAISLGAISYYVFSNNSNSYLYLIEEPLNKPLPFIRPKIETKTFNLPLLKGLELNPDNPWELNFYVDTMNKSSISSKEATRLTNYFLGFLAVPDDKLWVNLSPYEKERIIPKALEKLDIGKDLLIEDYLLKQLTSMISNPKSATGKKFWKDLQARLYLITGNTKLSINAFNKVWIMPDKAVVAEYKKSVGAGLAPARKTIAFIKTARLKVLMEEDYLALSKNKSKIIKPSKKKLSQNELINKQGKELFKRYLLPIIEDQVNNSQTFAPLRQLYYALILSAYFKRVLKNFFFYRYYIDKEKTQPITFYDSKIKNYIYKTYCQSFKEGVYRYIQNDYDQVLERDVLRQYTSGGFYGKYIQDAVEVEEGKTKPRVDGKINLVPAVIDAQAITTMAESLLKINEDSSLMSESEIAPYLLEENEENMGREIVSIANLLGARSIDSSVGQGTEFTDPVGLLEEDIEFQKKEAQEARLAKENEEEKNNKNELEKIYIPLTDNKELLLQEEKEPSIEKSPSKTEGEIFYDYILANMTEEEVQQALDNLSEESSEEFEIFFDSNGNPVLEIFSQSVDDFEEEQDLLNQEAIEESLDILSQESGDVGQEQENIAKDRAADAAFIRRQEKEAIEQLRAKYLERRRLAREKRIRAELENDYLDSGKAIDDILLEIESENPTEENFELKNIGDASNPSTEEDPELKEVEAAIEALKNYDDAHSPVLDSRLPGNSLVSNRQPLEEITEENSSLQGFSLETLGIEDLKSEPVEEISAEGLFSDNQILDQEILLDSLADFYLNPEKDSEIDDILKEVDSEIEKFALEHQAELLEEEEVAAENYLIGDSGEDIRLYETMMGDKTIDDLLNELPDPAERERMEGIIAEYNKEVEAEELEPLDDNDPLANIINPENREPLEIGEWLDTDDLKRLDDAKEALRLISENEKKTEYAELMAYIKEINYPDSETKHFPTPELDKEFLENYPDELSPEAREVYAELWRMVVSEDFGEYDEIFGDDPLAYDDDITEADLEEFSLEIVRWETKRREQTLKNQIEESLEQASSKVRAKEIIIDNGEIIELEELELREEDRLEGDSILSLDDDLERIERGEERIIESSEKISVSSEALLEEFSPNSQRDSVDIKAIEAEVNDYDLENAGKKLEEQKNNEQSSEEIKVSTEEALRRLEQNDIYSEDIIVEESSEIELSEKSIEKSGEGKVEPNIREKAARFILEKRNQVKTYWEEIKNKFSKSKPSQEQEPDIEEIAKSAISKTFRIENGKITRETNFVFTEEVRHLSLRQLADLSNRAFTEQTPEEELARELGIATDGNIAQIISKGELRRLTPDEARKLMDEESSKKPSSNEDRKEDKIAIPRPLPSGESEDIGTQEIAKKPDLAATKPAKAKDGASTREARKPEKTGGIDYGNLDLTVEGQKTVVTTGEGLDNKPVISQTIIDNFPGIKLRLKAIQDIPKQQFLNELMGK